MTTPPAGRPDSKRREPLWDRVDRNRFRLLAYLVVFTVFSSACIAFALVMVAVALFALGYAVSALRFLLVPVRWLVAGGVCRFWCIGLLLSVAYQAWALGRSEKWLLVRLGATFVPKGDKLETKMTLKDMAIASGMSVAPALYLLRTSNVNAFAFKAPGRRSVLGVTEGFISRLTVAEQRGVFANLVARVASGDTMVSSSMIALLAPLQGFRAHRLESLDIEDHLMEVMAEERRLKPGSEVGSPRLSYAAMLLPLLAPAVFASEVLAALQRRSQLTAAEKADAEGMLLLKDPASMLSALEQCVRLNNVVVEAGESLGDLFYCWTGDSSSDDEDDPEWSRVARLREVLGVEGWVPADPLETP